MDEFEIIKRYFAPLAAETAFGLKDDAALLPSRPGHDLVVTTDTISEGTDFFAFDPADAVAQKALRVNLSDLAAKGADPAHYLLSLTLPHTVTEDWLAAFTAGLARDQAEFGISLLGGDTGAGEGPLAITVTAFGYVPEGQMVKRDGARVGDWVYVTGTIGDSGGGLAIFRRERHALPDADRDYLTARYRLPLPPVGFAPSLRTIAHASVDISDGLMADLGHIASASSVRLVVDGERVPMSEPLRALWGEGALLRAVTAGDDYQIGFTTAPERTGPFTRIGRVEKGEGVSLTLNGRPVEIAKPGFRHF